MKTGIAGLELYYIIKELKFLENARVDKIYSPSKKELNIQFHVPSRGTHNLRIDERSAYLTRNKFFHKHPSEFCMFLRKKLNNSRLRKVSLVGFERILKLDFETKESSLSLVCEIFSKGNIILTKEDRILVASEYKKWASRTIRPNETYIPPEREHNFLEIDEKMLKAILQQSKKESVVKSIAMDLGLGGIYAEEACTLASIDKDSPPSGLDDKSTSSLFSALDSIRSREIDAVRVYDKQEIADITPFPLEYYKGFKLEHAESYSRALDYYFSYFRSMKEKEQKDQKVEKIKSIIKEQKKQIKDLEKKEQENREKAELLYQNYQQISSLISELEDISKKHSWKEIKEKLKGHKLIKEVIPKEKSIVIELG